MNTSFKMRVYKFFLSISDILIINLGFALAYCFKFGFQVPRYNLEPYLIILPWLSIGAFIIFYLFDLYSNWRRKSLYNLLYSVVMSILILIVFTMALTFWYRGFSFPRSVILLSALFNLPLFTVNRSLIWLFAKKKYGERKVLIIGKTKEAGLSIAEKFLQHAQGWFVLQGFHSVHEWAALATRIEQVDVILLSSDLNQQEKAEVISYCAKFGKEVLVVPELFELFILNSEPQQIDDMLVLSIQPPKLNPSQLFTKRFFDVVISGLLLILLSPIMVFTYLGVVLTSEGPGIFKQERLGRNGKPYIIYKFRSMVFNAEKKTGPVLATDNDSRITPFGRFIRSTRLDEIPQLFNVLKGNMSLVGPRPEREFFIEQFKAEIPDYTYRMSVKPGITGLAQVMAKYSTTAEDKLRYDLMYVRNYSFGLDLKILLQTIRVIFHRDQAGGVKTLNQKDRELFLKLLGDNEVAAVQESNPSSSEVLSKFKRIMK
ncbi:sugar transferase [Aneurinibacillus terranovensis]|uniref:sugar transferase n=1 Tax=Aneurinibacillus terranovensis TaxID=278991 RepID=UPI0003F9DC3E|nr:sugar transferase [Aneurinibacillus terranovensis]